MNQSLVSILKSLEPIIIFSAILPLFIALIMWAVFYIRYDVNRLTKIRDVLQKLTAEGEQHRDCKRENIAFMDEMIVRMAPSYFLEAWLRMQNQIEKNYQGNFLPEGKSFFDEEAMISVPGGRSRIDFLWKSFWVLGMMTIIAPTVLSYTMQPYGVNRSLALGFVSFIFLCFFYLIFTWMDQRIYQQTRDDYHRFIGVFDRILPVAKPEVVLLLEATQRNQESYQAATDKIAEKFDGIVEDLLLPALEDSIATIMHSNLIPAIRNIETTLDANLSGALDLQERGMNEMTAAFADRLGSTVEEKMLGLADAIGGMKDSLVGLNQVMMTQIDAVTQSVNHSVEKQEEGMERISAAFSESLIKTMETETQGLAATVGGIREQMEDFKSDLGGHITRYMEATTNQLDQQQRQTQEFIALQKDQTMASMDLQDQRIRQMMELQSENMKGIAEDFGATLLEEILSITGGLEQFKEQVGGLNEKLTVHLEGLGSLLADQHQTMETSAKVLLETGEIQERTLAEARDIQMQALENSSKWNDHVQNMVGILDNLSVQTTNFANDAFRFTQETSDLQMKMAEEVTLSQNRLETAVHETIIQYGRMNEMISDMMDNLTNRMKEAMAGAGKEIAVGIKEVTSDNAEAIANLTEQAQKLREDYENYFSRLDDTTVRTLEDMDYQVKTIIARITEDVGAMMENNIQANGDILEQYKDNTTNLLQSFDEQARSIGLYAKEINLDINDLSDNLRSSVEEFSQKMQEGIQGTLQEFDGGLAELTQRIANTVESISDAVEALPQALNRR